MNSQLRSHYSEQPFQLQEKESMRNESKENKENHESCNSIFFTIDDLLSSEALCTPEDCISVEEMQTNHLHEEDKARTLSQEPNLFDETPQGKSQEKEDDTQIEDIELLLGHSFLSSESPLPSETSLTEHDQSIDDDVVPKAEHISKIKEEEKEKREEVFSECNRLDEHICSDRTIQTRSDIIKSKNPNPDHSSQYFVDATEFPSEKASSIDAKYSGNEKNKEIDSSRTHGHPLQVIAKPNNVVQNSTNLINGKIKTTKDTMEHSNQIHHSRSHIKQGVHDDRDVCKSSVENNRTNGSVPSWLPFPGFEWSLSDMNAPIVVAEGLSMKRKRRKNARKSVYCSNCKVTETPLWRKGQNGDTVCNKCGLYWKRKGSNRPIQLRRAKRIYSSLNSPHHPSQINHSGHEQFISSSKQIADQYAGRSITNDISNASTSSAHHNQLLSMIQSTGTNNFYPTGPPASNAAPLLTPQSLTYLLNSYTHHHPPPPPQSTSNLQMYPIQYSRSENVSNLNSNRKNRRIDIHNHMLGGDGGMNRFENVNYNIQGHYDSGGYSRMENVGEKGKCQEQGYPLESSLSLPSNSSTFLPPSTLSHQKTLLSDPNQKSSSIQSSSQSSVPCGNEKKKQMQVIKQQRQNGQQIQKRDGDSDFHGGGISIGGECPSRIASQKSNIPVVETKILDRGSSSIAPTSPTPTSIMVSNNTVGNGIRNQTKEDEIHARNLTETRLIDSAQLVPSPEISHHTASTFPSVNERNALIEDHPNLNIQQLMELMKVQQECISSLRTQLSFVP